MTVEITIQMMEFSPLHLIVKAITLLMYDIKIIVQYALSASYGNI